MIQKLITEDDVRRIVRREISSALFGTAVVEKAGQSTAALFIDQEKEPTKKMYKAVNSYRPSEGDRVVVAKYGGTYVILGKLG